MPPEIIIALAATIIPIINNGLAFLAKARKVAAQGTEWTAEQRAEFEAEIEKLHTDPEEWQKPQPLG